MEWTPEADRMLASKKPDRDIAFELGTTQYQVHKRRSQLDLHLRSDLFAELYTEDIERLYHSLYRGQQVKISITTFGAYDRKREVIGTIREVYPHHAMCEYEEKIYSIQLKDIALKNRGLL